MNNPGLSKHTALPPLTTPKIPTTNNVVPPEPVTERHDVMKAPGPTGVATSPPVPATNGAAPILDYSPISATQSQPDPNVPANERRIEQQKQLGGGAKENPAYERAQDNIQEKMQRRRMSALYPLAPHEAALNDTTELNQQYNPDYELEGLRTFTDSDYPVPARATTSFQPMFSIKGRPDPEEPDQMDSESYYLPGELCETCWLKNDDQWTRKSDHDSDQLGHEFKPFDNPPNARFSSDLHGPLDMMAFEQAMGNQEDPYYNPMSHRIHDVDPRSPQYDSDYERGWQQAQKYVGDDGGQSPLEDMDDANVSHAAYDGYSDFAVGYPRRKWHMRAVRRLDIPDGMADDLPGQPNPMTDEQWEHPERVASVKQAETDEEFWAHQPDVREGIYRGQEHVMGGNPTCETCYLQGYQSPQWLDGADAHDEQADMGYSDWVDHPYKPMTMGKNERFSAANPGLRHHAESDEEFWARQPDVIDSSANDGYIDGLGYGASMSPDSGCETCYLSGRGPLNREHHWLAGTDHEFTPIRREPNERYSALFERSRDKDGLSHWWDTDFMPVQYDEEGARNETIQPMIDFKHMVQPGDPDPVTEADVQWDQPASYSGEPGCETCHFNGLYPYGKKFHEENDFLDHPYKPFAGSENARFSSQHPLFKQAETDDEWWSRQPDMKWHWNGGSPSTMSGTPACETCHLNGYEVPYWMDGEEAHERAMSDPDGDEDLVRHKYKPMTMGKNERFSSAFQVVAVVRTAETDDEFWARMDREHPGEQPETAPYTYLSPDAYIQQQPVERPAWHAPESDYEDWDLDPDEQIPQNMSSHEHSQLINSGVLHYNGNPDHPQYTHESHREVRDSEGAPAWAKEGHVIEHNPRHTGPVLPSDDDPNPHPFRYQWMHEYYPAGLADDEGLYKGYNSAEEALKAVYRLNANGPRHPRSQELLSGYRNIGDDMPYDPRMHFPAEFSRTAAFDEARGEWLYNIDRPGYWNTDRPPSSVGSSNQGDPEDGRGFFSERRIPYEEGEPQPVEDAEGFLTSDPKLDDSFWHHPGYQVCETCKAMGLDPSRSPERHKTIPGYHPYSPLPDTAPGERLASVNPGKRLYAKAQ